MTLASNYNDPTSLLVHDPQNEKGEEPMAKIVRGKGSVESLIRPRLLTKVLEAGVEDESTDRRDFTRGDPSLCRELPTYGKVDQ